MGGREDGNWLASTAHWAQGNLASAERRWQVGSLSSARMIEIDDDHLDGPLLRCGGNRAVGQRQPPPARRGHVSPGVGPDWQMHNASHPIWSSLHLDGMATTTHALRRHRSGCRSNRYHIIQAEFEPVGRAAISLGSNSHPVGVVEAVADSALLLRNPALDHPVHAKHGDGLALSSGRWLRSEARQWPMAPRLRFQAGLPGETTPARSTAKGSGLLWIGRCRDPASYGSVAMTCTAPVGNRTQSCILPAPFVAREEWPEPGDWCSRATASVDPVLIDRRQARGTSARWRRTRANLP